MADYEETFDKGRHSFHDLPSDEEDINDTQEYYNSDEEQEKINEGELMMDAADICCMIRDKAIEMNIAGFEKSNFVLKVFSLLKKYNSSN